jgi:molybdopterin-biosynthesis enzyme MoeA-like protein
MSFGLIIIGDEILSGRRQDKHMAKVIELLGARGHALAWASYIGDERPRITAALREAMSSGDVHFVPGFPVMAHPMIEWVLDRRCAHLRPAAHAERALFVQGGMEATLTPLMEAIEAAHPGVRIFSLPSVDHPVRGRHIELGVKGEPGAVDLAFGALQSGLSAFQGLQVSTE